MKNIIAFIKGVWKVLTSNPYTCGACGGDLQAWSNKRSICTKCGKSY